MGRHKDEIFFVYTIVKFDMRLAINKKSALSFCAFIFSCGMIYSTGKSGWTMSDFDKSEYSFNSASIICKLRGRCLKQRGTFMWGSGQFARDFW